MTKAANSERRLEKKYHQQSQIQNPGHNDIMTWMMETTSTMHRLDNQIMHGEKLKAIVDWFTANEPTDNGATEFRRLRSALCHMRDAVGDVLAKLPDPTTDVSESAPASEAAAEMVQ